MVETMKEDVNYRDQNGCTSLHAAAAGGQLEVVEWLMSHSNIDSTAADDVEQTALHYAAFHGHLEVVQLLVDQGVPMDTPDKYGRLVHNAAALNGHLDVITYLLEECKNPIDINAIDEYGGTCLHWAALKGRKEVVQYLCMRGIDLHLTSYDNRTAYQLAKDKHKSKCVQFLKAWTERVQQFVSAAEEGNVGELQRITAEINGTYPLRHLKDKDGKNALHLAAGSGHLETLKLLSEHFDVLTDVDKFGRNALHWAALGGHKDCALWLVKNVKGSSLIHCLTLTNKSPSRCAFEAGHSALASKLQSWEEGHDEVQVASKKVEDLPGPTPQTEEVHENKDVDDWLKHFKMSDYTENFTKDGFDTLRGVATIVEKDLKEMDLKKGHRRIVLSHVEELKKQLATIDDEAKCSGEEVIAEPTLTMLPAFNKSIRQSVDSNSRLSKLPSSGSDVSVDALSSTSYQSAESKEQNNTVGSIPNTNASV